MFKTNIFKLSVDSETGDINSSQFISEIKVVLLLVLKTSRTSCDVK
jgi:hypothetical protein